VLIFMEIIGGAILLLILFGPAFLAGRAIARRWNPWWHAALWMLPYAAALQFLHYALFHRDLLSLSGYLTMLAGAVVVAVLGHRLTRVRQMAAQYPWLYQTAGPFSWRRKATA
jgi:hypothetical protein